MSKGNPIDWKKVGRIHPSIVMIIGDDNYDDDVVGLDPEDPKENFLNQIIKKNDFAQWLKNKSRKPKRLLIGAQQATRQTFKNKRYQCQWLNGDTYIIDTARRGERKKRRPKIYRLQAEIKVEPEGSLNFKRQLSLASCV